MNKFEKNVNIGKDNQLEMDIDSIESRVQYKERIEKEKIIKEDRIPVSFQHLLNKKRDKWFMGEKTLVDWINEKREEERGEDQPNWKQ